MAALYAHSHGGISFALDWVQDNSPRVCVILIARRTRSQPDLRMSTCNDGEDVECTLICVSSFEISRFFFQD